MEFFIEIERFQKYLKAIATCLLAVLVFHLILEIRRKNEILQYMEDQQVQFGLDFNAEFAEQAENAERVPLPKAVNTPEKNSSKEREQEIVPDASKAVMKFKYTTQIPTTASEQTQANSTPETVTTSKPRLVSTNRPIAATKIPKFFAKSFASNPKAPTVTPKSTAVHFQTTTKIAKTLTSEASPANTNKLKPIPTKPVPTRMPTTKLTTIKSNPTQNSKPMNSKVVEHKIPAGTATTLWSKTAQPKPKRPGFQNVRKTSNVHSPLPTTVSKDMIRTCHYLKRHAIKVVC